MDNRTLLVVGASSDMGMNLIQTMAGQYDSIIAHYRRPSSALETLTTALEGKIRLVQADLSDIGQTEGLVSQIRDTGITPTHIVHFSAPLCDNKKFAKMDWALFESMWNISFRSIAMVCKAFLPAMAKQGGGKVVMTLSRVVNNMPPKYCSQYVSVKYAMLGLMKALAVEYADKKITVNGVSPAWVKTGYLENQPDLLLEKNAMESPIQRLLTVDDVVPVIAFLLSDAAGCINGQNITVTGGE